MPSLFLSAGDASGEQHLADFVRAFRALRPETRFVGMGGDRMAAEGVELVVHQRELAVGGLFELAAAPQRIVSTWRRMDRALREASPDLVVLTDSSGFNLPFARRVRRHCAAPILYYVAPQVWAWRSGRIRKLAQRVDQLAVILPFEAEVYAGAGLPVEFVGHPLVDALCDSGVGGAPGEARARLGISGEGPVVALLPGSRRNEIHHQLPIQLEAARQLEATRPGCSFVLALAPTIDPASIEPALRRAGESVSLRVVQGRTLDAIRASDVVLVKPGTGTVEVMLLDRPMVVMGRANRLTAAVLRRAVRAPYFAMPNLIAGREIVPELLQEDAEPQRIARALAALLEGPERERQMAALREVRTRLGKGGAAARTAQIADAMLRDRSGAG